MHITFMGTFSASIDGVEFAPKAMKPCRILALLALHPGRTVPATECMDELWGDAPPASATTTLQTYIHKLRRCIGGAIPAGSSRSASDYLRTERGGYALDLGDGTTDILEFQRLVDAAAATDDPVRAGAALREGLALRTGPFLSDLALGARMEMHGRAVEDRIMAARLRRIQLDLELGRHHDVVWELRELLRADPLNEGLSAQYMTVLHHTGQVHLALGEYQRLRRALVQELGVEPSPPIRHLHSSLLRRPGTAATVPLAS